MLIIYCSNISCKNLPATCQRNHWQLSALAKKVSLIDWTSPQKYQMTLTKNSMSKAEPWVLDEWLVLDKADKIKNEFLYKKHRQSNTHSSQRGTEDHKDQHTKGRCPLDSSLPQLSSLMHCLFTAEDYNRMKFAYFCNCLLFLFCEWWTDQRVIYNPQAVDMKKLHPENKFGVYTTKGFYWKHICLNYFPKSDQVWFCMCLKNISITKIHTQFNLINHTWSQT